MISISMREEGGVPKVVSFEKEQVTIGRAADNDLCLTGRGISGRHCRFFRTPGGIVLEDLGSTNGTYLNRKRLQHPVRVSGRDEIVLAMYELRLLDSAGSVHESIAPHSNEARIPGSPPLTSEGAAVATPSDPRRVLTAAVVAPPLTGPWHPASVPPPTSATPGVVSGADGKALTGQGRAVDPSTSAVPSRVSSGDSIAPPSGGDADWAREWKKIDMLARAWIDAGRDRSLLLRGQKLAHARRWLSTKAGKSPAPRREHQDFIQASVRASHLRLTRNIGLGSAALVVVAVSATKVSPILFPPPVIEEPKREGPEEDPKNGTSVTTTSTPEELHREALAAAAVAAEVLDDDPSMATLVAMNALDHISARERGSQPEQVLRAGLSKLEGVPLLGHDKAVTTVGFSPNGRWAYSASDDFTARVWDLESRGLIAPYVLRGHIAELRGVAVTPDSHYVFTAAVDGSILRWDLTHAQPNTTAEPLRGHEYTVTALALSGDGRWLASGANDGVLRVWDAAHPAVPPKKASGHDAPIRSLSFSRDGSMLASAGEDALGNLWRVDETGTPARRGRLEGHEGPVHAIALSPDKRWVLTGSDDRTARLWDPAKKIPALTHRILSGHEGSVRRVAITPDGTLAVTAGDDSHLMVWNLESKEPELGAVKFDLHQGGITDLAVTGAQESGGDRPRIVASASLDQTARTWNLERREHEQSSMEFRGLGDTVSSVGFSSDGLRLIVGARNGSLKIWDHQTQGSGGASRAAVGHPSGILDVAVNVVGTRMVTAGADSTARIWDLTSPGWVKQLSVLPEHKGRVRTTAIDQGGRFVATAGDDGIVRLWALDKADPAANHLPLRGHKSVVNKIAFLPDDSALVSISADKTARYWPLTQTAEKDSVVLPHRDEVNSMALSHDGRWLVTGTLSQVYRWDLEAQDIPASGRPLDGKGRNRLHEVDILAVGIGPDGRWAASSSQDPTLVLWDLADQGASIRLRRHSEPVDTIAFSPDGQWLATGSRDRTIRLWDLKAEHPDETSLLLSGHEGRVGSLRFSSDSSRLMSGGYDKTVRIWDLRTRDENQISKTAMVLQGHDQLISAIDMSGDERLIVSASYDGTARVWPLDAEELIAIGCRRVGRNLTPEEWTRHFSDNYKALCPYE